MTGTAQRSVEVIERWLSAGSLLKTHHSLIKFGNFITPCLFTVHQSRITNHPSPLIVDLNRVHPILLQTFLEVADAGQISEAARRLHLSQPAVTGQIRRLESNLERTLFIRTPRGVSLTPEGTRLRDRLQGVFAENRSRARLMDSGRSGRVMGDRCSRLPARTRLGLSTQRNHRRLIHLNRCRPSTKRPSPHRSGKNRRTLKQ
jgi:molybdenum-dependent DNA-binding transcriptional regulator ModE